MLERDRIIETKGGGESISPGKKHCEQFAMLLVFKIKNFKNCNKTGKVKFFLQ